MKGFRDDFTIDVNAITELITYLELRATDSRAEADEIIKEIKAASKNATHMCVKSIPIMI
jgi:putative protein kinase ArgK-like GTPase of G3E family